MPNSHVPRRRETCSHLLTTMTHAVSKHFLQHNTTLNQLVFQSTHSEPVQPDMSLPPRLSPVVQLECALHHCQWIQASTRKTNQTGKVVHSSRTGLRGPRLLQYFEQGGFRQSPPQYARTSVRRCVRHGPGTLAGTRRQRL